MYITCECAAGASGMQVPACVPVILFANKADLLTDPLGSLGIGASMEKLCRDCGFYQWFISSARNGDCVDDG